MPARARSPRGSTPHARADSSSARTREDAVLTSQRRVGSDPLVGGGFTAGFSVALGGGLAPVRMGFSTGTLLEVALVEDVAVGATPAGLCTAALAVATTEVSACLALGGASTRSLETAGADPELRAAAKASAPPKTSTVSAPPPTQSARPDLGWEPVCTWSVVAVSRFGFDPPPSKESGGGGGGGRDQCDVSAPDANGVRAAANARIVG